MESKDDGAGLTARVTSAFPGVPDGEVYPRKIAVGTTIRGDLALTAIAAGWAELIQAPLETKTEVGSDVPFQDGPANKSSSAPPVPAKGKTISKRPAGKRG